MNRRGIISTLDMVNRIATLTFPDLDNAVSGPLPINESEDLTGYSVGDIVAAMFFSNDLTDGVIVCRIGGG